MITLYKGKKVEVTGEFLLPRAIMFGVAYGQTEIGIALGIIALCIDWSGDDEH